MYEHIHTEEEKPMWSTTLIDVPEPKIIDYTIVSSSDTDILFHTIKLRIKNGWQPLGGVARENGIFHQAMIKREEEEC